MTCDNLRISMVILSTEMLALSGTCDTSQYPPDNMPGAQEWQCIPTRLAEHSMQCVRESGAPVCSLAARYDAGRVQRMTVQRYGTVHEISCVQFTPYQHALYYNSNVQCRCQ